MHDQQAKIIKASLLEDVYNCIAIQRFFRYGTTKLSP